MNFNQQLAFLRKARGISQENLADMLGVSRQAVSRWETSETQPEMANLLAICEILKVTPNQLMGWEEMEEPEEAESCPPRKKSKFAAVIAVICVCLALAAGIFAGMEIEASKAPVSLLEGKTNMEITGFIYDFNGSIANADLKMTVIPAIADEKLEYQIVAIGGPEGDKVWPAEYKDGICTAYVQTVPYYEIVYVLRVSDGKNFINKSLFKVLSGGDYTWTHQELWQD